jgi:hypothetical protein
VLVVAETAIFCDPFEITALDAVKLSVSIVVAEPVMVPPPDADVMWPI